MNKVISAQLLTKQLLDLGVEPGGMLVVHCAFSQVAPVENGPRGLITALRTALGPKGTLVMPSMSDDDEQPFDPLQTSCLGMGIVAHTFWQLPGVLRSDSQHAFAAVGPQADLITAPHPLDFPHGLDSPVGRVFELDGQVLLLGVGHDANTTIHLGEALGGVRYRIKKQTALIQDGKIVQVEYGEIDHCCQNFHLVDEWLTKAGKQRQGTVGQATARLMRSQDVIQVVTEQLQQNKTIFLHPWGVDEECDRARASLKWAS